MGWAKPGTENLYNIIMMEELQTVVSVGGGGVTKLCLLYTSRQSEQLEITLHQLEHKVDLNASEILKRLRKATLED